MPKSRNIFVLAALCVVLISGGACADPVEVAASFGSATKTGNVQSSLVIEASGLAASRKNANVLWVHNDSGDVARVFAMDTAGKHLGVYNLTGVIARDWEDIAIGPGLYPGTDYLYIGDIGDNTAVRSTIQVYRVEEPVMSASQTPVTINLTGVVTYTLTYEDGPRDAETLMIDPQTKDLYIVSKRQSRSRLYRAAAADLASGNPVTLRFKAELPWGWATAGDISPTGREIIIRGYWKASLWRRPPGSELWNAFKGKAYTIPLPFEILGEAICFEANGQGYYTTSEGANRPIYYFPRLAPAKPTCFYMEEPTRQAGIRVTPTGGLNDSLERGSTVTVTGTLATTTDGERQLADATVEIASGMEPLPLGCSERSLRSYGLSTEGLLMTAFGTISLIDPAGSRFWLDDGSGSAVGVSFDGRAYDTGKLLAITGISSCYRESESVSRSLLLVRNLADVQAT